MDMATNVSSNIVIDAFNSLGWDTSIAARGVAGYSTLSSWRTSQTAQVAAAGAAAMAVPGAHLLALTADVGFLLHKMSICAWGIGFKLGATVDGEDDMAVILGLWAGALEPDALSVGTAAVGVSAGWMVLNATYPTYGAAVMAKVLAAGAGSGVSAVGAKIAGKKSGKALAKLSKPFLQKIAQKIAVKFSALLGSKAATGAIPILGALAGAGINSYFIMKFADAAETYYRAKIAAGG
ncbi:hypothetical protein ABZW18_09025 [Streptomyces sp. NPDC004647]|uniref:hypothetical protein n=1 Tax=Streptomyces sp. NPDC004647 TaxID=3154671 RepID=UPI0033B67383